MAVKLKSEDEASIDKDAICMTIMVEEESTHVIRSSAGAWWHGTVESESA